MPTDVATFIGADGKQKEEEFDAFSDEEAIKIAQKFGEALLEQKGRVVAKLAK